MPSYAKAVTAKDRRQAIALLDMGLSIEAVAERLGFPLGQMRRKMATHVRRAERRKAVEARRAAEEAARPVAPPPAAPSPPPEATPVANGRHVPKDARRKQPQGRVPERERKPGQKPAPVVGPERAAAVAAQKPVYEPALPSAHAGFVPSSVRRFTAAEEAIIASLAAYGAQDREIAALMRCTEATLRRACGAIMDLAVMRMNAQAARFLFKQMRAGSTQATIYWLKTRGGAAWRETQHVNIEGLAGVLVTPGGIDPDRWIETEAVRTALPFGGVAGEDVLESGGAAGVTRELVERVREQRAGGAVAPWEDGGAREDVDVLDMAYEPLPVGRIQAPRGSPSVGNVCDPDVGQIIDEDDDDDVSADVDVEDEIAALLGA